MSETNNHQIHAKEQRQSADAGVHAPNARPTPRVRLPSLHDLDGRTRIVRTTHERLARYERDLGGRDNLTAAQRDLVKTAAMLGTVIEGLAARMIDLKPADLSEYRRLLYQQQRLLDKLGLKREHDGPPLMTDAQFDRLLALSMKEPA